MLFRSLELNFDVSFDITRCDTISKDLFTGTLPAKNLDEVLLILAKLYDFVYERDGSTIVITTMKK